MVDFGLPRLAGVSRHTNGDDDGGMDCHGKLDKLIACVEVVSVR